jgi:MEMO1 family protein
MNKSMTILSAWLLLIQIQVAETAELRRVRPVRDDVGFCWDMETMKRLVLYLQLNEGDMVDPEGLIAGISPHDDYLYAGRLYFPLFRAIRCREVVIFGVTHATVRQEIKDPQGVLLMDDFSHWRGLDKDIPVSPLREYIVSRSDSSMIRVNRRAHELEHSIEALVPFLHYFNPDLKLTAIMVTAMPLERMEKVSDHLADLICQYATENNLQLGQDIFFLMSSDANHYGHDFNNAPYGENEKGHAMATAEDLGLAKSYLTGTMDGEKIRGLVGELWGTRFDQPGNFLWCGRYSIPFGLLTIGKVVQLINDRPIRGVLIRYSDTYSEGVIPLKRSGMGITAPFSLKHWVGFFSAAFYIR